MWSMDSSSTLLKKYPLTKGHPLLLSCSKVNNSPLTNLPSENFTLENTPEFQITLVGQEIDSFDSKATYKGLTENLLLLESIHTILSSPSPSITTPSNLENNLSTLSNFQSFKSWEKQG